MGIGTGEAILASTGANILAGAFGGNGSGTANLNLRRERTQRRALYGLENENIGNRLKAYTSGAKAAGLHPLFAMGSSAGNSSQQFSMPGQAATGSFKSNALEAIGAGFANIAQVQAQADLIDKQNEAAKLRIADQPGFGNDAALGIEGQVINALKSQNPHADEVLLQPNVQRTRSSKDTSVAAGSNPAWMSIEMWPGIFMDVPWSEEGFADSIDGLPQIAVTLARNAGIGYQKAYRAARRALFNYRHLNYPDKRRTGIQKYKRRNQVKHPGSMRKRNYAGAQPYRPLGGRY